MSEPVSSYYPPRANWLKPFRRGWGVFWRLMPAVDIPRIPHPIPLRAFLPAVLIPGLGFRLTGRPRLAQWALSIYAAALGVFVVRLGYAEASLCFALLLAIHASGATSVWVRIFELVDVRRRCLASGVALFVLGAGLYWPALGLSERWLVRPLSINGRVVVVRSLASAKEVRRGDVIACRIESSRTGEAGNVHMVREGFVLGPVMALPGDTIRFTPGNVLVNGHADPREATMPAEGELRLAPGTWFLWPRVEIAVGHAGVTEELLRLSQMPQANFVGRPFHHWFLRRQHFE
jgi:hypothetical protein